MKIILTGSLGHIGSTLATTLVQKGHSVTVITSKAERKNEIVNIGAIAAVGSIDNVDFLTETFKGADIVYLMEPPINFLDADIIMDTYWQAIAKSYVEAILNSGVTKVIHLSSIGAHTDKGVGMLAAHYWVENILKELPHAVSIKTMRPVGFYYNMFAFIPAIKNANAIIQNYNTNEKEPWVSPLDIAAAITEEMEKPFNGRSIRYIASDEVTPHEVAKILGEAIGKKDLKWLAITDDEFVGNLVRAGFIEQNAKGLANMNAARMNDTLYEDYNRNKPTLGQVKLTDFAKDFANAYHSSNNHH
ncbi:SDR family oxidoreductase [Pedobacter sp.]|uniref:SDR family oxidoreductase n=1 Tax=Pedobacter sp. TaxID=1411316 RepID=UPI003D7FA1CF